MTRLACLLTVVLMSVGGAFTWNASAMPIAQTGDSLARIMNYSMIHKTGCAIAGIHCRAGFKWVCTSYAAPGGKRCRCAPC